MPGGLQLTAEAALRAGAGRVQLATLACLALPLGVAVPEAGVFALPEDDNGEIAWNEPDIVLQSMDGCDCVVVGPAMAHSAAAEPIARSVLGCAHSRQGIVLDAAAICPALFRDSSSRNYRGRVVITPNAGEMGRLLDTELNQISRDPQKALERAVEFTGVTVMLKGAVTWMATPEGEKLSYSTGDIGLATGGSGDVLAGILGGLLARGMSARDACAWAVWLHGEAGRMASEQQGPVGYLARELSQFVPTLMQRQ